MKLDENKKQGYYRPKVNNQEIKEPLEEINMEKTETNSIEIHRGMKPAGVQKLREGNIDIQLLIGKYDVTYTLYFDGSKSENEILIGGTLYGGSYSVWGMIPDIKLTFEEIKDRDDVRSYILSKISLVQLEDLYSALITEYKICVEGALNRGDAFYNYNPLTSRSSPIYKR